MDDITGQVDLEIGLYDADSDTLITEITGGEEILASTLAGRAVTLVARVPEASPLFGEVESLFLDLNQGAISPARRMWSPTPCLATTMVTSLAAAYP